MFWLCWRMMPICMGWFCPAEFHASRGINRDVLSSSVKSPKNFITCRVHDVKFSRLLIYSRLSWGWIFFDLVAKAALSDALPNFRFVPVVPMGEESGDLNLVGLNLPAEVGVLHILAVHGRATFRYNYKEKWTRKSCAKWPPGGRSSVQSELLRLSVRWSWVISYDSYSKQWPLTFPR